MKRFVWKCKKELALFLSTNCIWAAIGISLAYILELITDTAMNRVEGRIALIILLSILYLIFDTTFEFLSSHSEVLLRTKISFFMRNALVRRIQRCSVEEKEKVGDAHYLSMLNNNVGEVESEYVHGILMVVFQLFSLVFALIATTLIQPVLTLILIVLCILPIFVPRLLKAKLEKVNRDALDARASYLNFLNELLEGFLTIKIFARQREVNRFHDEKNSQTTKKIQRNFKWKRLSMSLSYGMGNMVVLGAWVLGVIFTLSGSIDLPELVALTTLMNMVAGPFQIISEYYAGIISGRAVAKDLLQFIDSGAGEDEEYQCKDARIHSIELQNVSLLRDGKRILNHIDFSAKAGQKICLIGSSGSGKTSLLKAIAGIVEVSEGHVCLNESDRKGKRGLLHPDVLFLPQNTVLFSATIADNIALFQDMPPQKIEDAIDKSGLLKWFVNSGRNVHKMIGKNQANLSGGELRRIDFARTLVEDAQVLLFDEPTAGLDQFHAKNIMDQVCALTDRIIIVATHDLDRENMARFDVVYMIEDGSIAACDTPENMINNMRYQSLKNGKAE
ncbi:MAG: ABC transporter ATP-binding protein/permease [bacterium]|nr:ABC transporter ATP-binding protein/permease [bacterium]